MADDNLQQRLTTVEARLEGIETAIAALTAQVVERGVEATTHFDAIERELLKGDERHAELLAAIRDLRDQSFVQGGILLRLEHRDHDADATTAALQQQIQRLERRLDRLERGG